MKYSQILLFIFLLITSELLSQSKEFEERANLKKVTLSSGEKGYLISKGKIELKNQASSKEEILDCILNSIVSIGIEETSKNIDDQIDYEYVKGKWEYTYYVNNSSDYAGIVEFKYEFKITNGAIEYRYYDFIHSKDDSNFESIGQLPYKINQSVESIFTNEQYQEIIDDIHLNQILAVKRTKTYTDKCIK